MQEALQAEKGRLQLALAEEERSVLAAEAQHPSRDTVGKLQPAAEAEDELDAFMGQVAVQLEHDKVSLLQCPLQCPLPCPLQGQSFAEPPFSCLTAGLQSCADSIILRL